ncbi:tRNA pseudouridine(38-40) synthase TruA [Vagococcus penaei]|uniref:tRNA pseudouridine synthase A n=1 Tax=Vagococcus penaei TaxID=633807 RepID=A0A1Q2D690_9ENTE|nr:tRNA pseudouridine(38-40) synthase TruA [Vagococcus penaei]AQP53832.1 tRNA pseudouridine(38-40) synthase TruA [Vagococcus penaei]RST98876.1 tRNA pseudouridine(38-40) synthase TruA [Vagococcus penaei]
MPRYKATIQYDGTNYAGFQRQTNARSIQETIETVLTRLNGGQSVVIHPSGRTDSGVHALGQVIHFDLPQARDTEKLRFALDTQCPSDISVSQVESVSDTFHARYLATEKTYHYYVDTSVYRSPFKRLYSAHYTFTLDLDKMRQAAQDIVGTHDFTVFCAVGSPVEDKTRTVHEVVIEELSPTELRFVFRGNGFLYKMVRLLMGTLLRIGAGKLPIDTIQTALKTQDKKIIGPTAHPEGLFLVEVRYDEEKNEI